MCVLYLLIGICYILMDTWQCITFLQCLCTYIHSYLASFLFSICVHWLARIAMPCLDIDTSRRVVFWMHWLFVFTNWEAKLTNNINRIFSYLPTSWLDKHEEVNGDSTFNERSILCTKSIFHSKGLDTKQYWMRHCM